MSRDLSYLMDSNYLLLITMHSGYALGALLFNNK